jgi:hypothetical protein
VSIYRDQRSEGRVVSAQHRIDVLKLGITGATFAGGHGSNGPQSGLEAIMAQK